MHITAEWLRSEWACEDQVKTFEREWPKGVAISPASLHRAAELRLDLRWLANHILSKPAWKAYEEATRAAKDWFDREAILWSAIESQDMAVGGGN